ncbi:MAG: galactokinase, partial [Desulfobacterales bacterium]
MNLYERLSRQPVTASAPCRVDLGGTLDIGVFFLALADKRPATFNLALDLRTRVELLPHTPGKIKVSSKGFEPAEFDRGKAPFDHPMGLVFAVAQYFDVHGVHIHISSASPPRSALGGSSAAEAAVIAAIMHACGMDIQPQAVVHLAQSIESASAGVVCGVQDHAAAV